MFSHFATTSIAFFNQYQIGSSGLDNIILIFPSYICTLGPSGHEMDVDDTRDLVIHDVKELQNAGTSCGGRGADCRRRKREVTPPN